MIKKKRMIAIAIISVFVMILFSQFIYAKENINQEKILTLWMPGISKDNYFTQIEITEEELQIFIDEIYTSLNVINKTMIPDSTGISVITYEEWQKISENVCTFIDSAKCIIEDFPDIDTEKYITGVIEGFFRPLPGFFRPKPYFSAGLGSTWIPFYEYETFIGLLVRPMVTRYQFGFSHVGGLAQCRFTIGKFFMVNTCFCGLFINLGNIGMEKVMGPTLYIGTVFTSRI